jgi:hypothetical protein
MVFQPGVSGNPGGRPKGQSELTELLRQRIPAERLVGALDKLIEAGDPKATIYAIDRQLGKPAQSIQVSGDPERPLHALIGVVARDLQPLAAQDAPEALSTGEAHCLDDLDGA